MCVCVCVRVCVEDCIDLHPMCQRWADEGECEANPNYMVGNSILRGHCRKACGLCAPASQTPSGELMCVCVCVCVCVDCVHLRHRHPQVRGAHTRTHRGFTEEGTSTGARVCEKRMETDMPFGWMLVCVYVSVCVCADVLKTHPQLAKDVQTLSNNLMQVCTVTHIHTHTHLEGSHRYRELQDTTQAPDVVFMPGMDSVARTLTHTHAHTRASIPTARGLHCCMLPFPCRSSSPEGVVHHTHTHTHTHTHNCTHRQAIVPSLALMQVVKSQGCGASQACLTSTTGLGGANNGVTVTAKIEGGQLKQVNSESCVCVCVCVCVLISVCSCVCLCCSVVSTLCAQPWPEKTPLSACVCVRVSCIGGFVLGRPSWGLPELVETDASRAVGLAQRQAHTQQQADKEGSEGATAQGGRADLQVLVTHTHTHTHTHTQHSFSVPFPYTYTYARAHTRARPCS